jgi:hypothetical protein
MNIKLLLFAVFLGLHSFGQTHQLIITEIMADPTPSKGLPEREYLEIYNPSPEAINLKNFKLYYGNFSVSFPDSIIKSNAYAIVFRKGYEAEFKNFGSIIPLPNFSLSNEGALLVLQNQGGHDVFHINYSSSWHNLKNEGGISLEMIDTSFPCVKNQNWTSSTDAIGGTPGKANSIKKANPDISGPKLLNFNLDINVLTLNFDEDVSIDFIKEKNNFKIKDGLNEVIDLSYELYQSNKVIIKLKHPVEEGESIELIVDNLEDCSGNISERLLIALTNLVPAQLGEILLSEILFNPKTGGEDFVELFNSSDKILNLRGWKFAKLNSKGEISEISEIATYDLLIKPRSYMAFSKDKNYLQQNYPKTGHIIEVLKMPSFNNDEGTVIVLDKNDVEFDRFSYTEKMHNQLIVNPEGISIERTNYDLTKKSIWTSAAVDFGFATPGLPNSQGFTENVKNVFYAEPIVFNPYQLSGNPTTFLKYNLNGQGFAAKIDIMDKNGKLVRNLSNNTILGSSGEIEWDGLSNAGELLPVGYYVYKVKLYSPKINQDFLVKCVIGSN